MKKIVLLALIISGCSGLFAQPTPLSGIRTSDVVHRLNGNQSAPLDGGLSILLALGAIYGVKKMNETYKMRNKLKME